jgi:Arc/MetJ-type ribon-helix-helix transcriptional regulator
MSKQIAVRIPDAMSEALEQLVADEEFDSVAEATRAALETLIVMARRRRVGEAIAEGYRRMPQTDEEIRTAHRLALRSIEDEPW